MVGSVLAGALRFRVLLAGLAAGLIVAGVISLPSMHSDTIPELASGPVLEVQTEVPGLSSEEVEQYVTVPMENNLLDGIMDVWDMRSQSTPGLATVDLYFQPGTTLLHARQLVTERLTAAFELPNVAKPPLLIQPLSSTSRVLMIGLHSTSIGPLQLSYLARWIVKPKLLGVTGVSQVAIFGERDRQVQVLVDPKRLAAHHVTLDQIIRTAGNAQLVSPLNFLEGSTPGTGGFLDGPNQRLDIRPVLPLGTPHDLASVPVAGAASKLPLGDVTTLVKGSQPMIGDAIVGSDSNLVLEVEKLPSASVVGVTNGLEKALGDLRPALRGIQFNTSFFKPATYVRSSLHNEALGLIITSALVLLALAALLLDLRAVAVSAVSVAVALALAVLVLQALGQTFNAMVVLGLLTAAGVVIDDALGATVQIMRSLRLRRESETSDTSFSILEACTPLRSTLGYATLFILLAVAPVFFSKGLTATFVHPLVLTFGLALLASMLVAFTVTPALAWLLLSWGPRGRRAAWIQRRVGELYQVALRRVLALPALVLHPVLLIGLAGIIALPFIEQPAPPRFLDRSLVVNWDGPAGASLQEMDRITRRAVSELQALPSVSSAAAILGRAVSADQIVDTNSGQIFVSLKPSADYDQSVSSIRAVVQGTPGIRASVSTYENDVMQGVLTSPRKSVDVRIYGEDYSTLSALARRVQAAMRSVHGLGRARVLLPAVQPNIVINLNDQAAFKAGVSAGDARREASALIYGLTVGNFFEQQAVFDVFVRGTPATRSTVGDVRNLLLDTSNGGHVRLSQIASVGVHPDPIDIRHEAVSRYVDVTAPVLSGSLGAAQDAIRSGLGKISYPLTYHAQILGGNPFDGTSHETYLFYLLAAFIGALLLAQAAFGSWGLAAAFMASLPFALGGGLLVAAVTGQFHSIGTDAGLLAVLAIAVRQGMLQVATLRRLQAHEGGSLTADMIQRGAAERLAPSLTAHAVIAVAMLPFVIQGDVAGNEITHVTAAVVLGGLVTTMLLTQLAFPALCLALGLSRRPPPDDSLAGAEFELPDVVRDGAPSEAVVEGGHR